MERSIIIVPFTKSIKDIVNTSDACTFLVGAGISMDPPSCLPSAREICRVLLGFCTPADSVEELLSLQTLRYELIVEEMQKYIDKDLKFMDYFDVILNPNFVHEFLARAVIQKHHVVTTNFDYLIERALMKVLPGDKHGVIRSVITRRDFETYKDAIATFSSGLLPVYKIHGSRKNLLTGEDTRESLVTTISALGRDRAEGETFAIEPYKKPAVESIMNGRVLIVMGYSGSDDFDIGPVLKELPHLRRLIWVDHVQGEAMEALEIKKEARFGEVKGLSKVEALLAEIRHDAEFDVFLVRSNTSRFVRTVLWPILLPGMDASDLRVPENAPPQQPSFKDWAAPFYTSETDHHRYLLSAVLLADLRQFKSSIKASEKGLVLATSSGTPAERGSFLNMLAMVNESLGNYDDSLKFHEESLQIDVKTGFRDGEATGNNGIGVIHYHRGNYTEAIRYFEKAIEISKALDIASGRGGSDGYSAKTGHYFNNLAKVYLDTGQNDKAFALLEEAIKAASKDGDLDAKAKDLSNIAQIFKIRGDYQRALESLDEALRIDVQLGNIRGMGARYSFIGGVYYAQGHYDKARECYEKNLAISDQMGDYVGKGTALANLAAVAIARDELDKALPLLEDALRAAEKAKTPLYIALRHAKIGQVHQKRKAYPDAIKEFQIAIDIDRQIGALDSLAINLNNLALVYSDAGDLETSLALHKEGLTIASQTGNKETVDGALFNVRERIKDIGDVYANKKEYGKAIDLFTSAMNDEVARGDKKNEAVFLFWIGRTQYKANEDAKARETLLQATSIHESIKNERGVSDCAYYLGLIEAEAMQHATAVSQFTKALTLETKRGKLDDQGHLLGKIAKSLANVDGAQAAAVPRSMLDPVTAIATKSSDTNAAIDYINSAGKFYEKNKLVDAAIDTYEAGIAIARVSDNRKALQLLLSKGAALHRDRKEFQTAISMLEESLKIVTELGDSNTIAFRHSNLGLTYFKAKDFERAIAFYVKAKDLFTKIGDEKNVKIAAENADAVRKAAQNKG